MITWQQYFFGKWANIQNTKPEDTECIKLCNVIRQAILLNKFKGVFLHIENETGGKRNIVYNTLKKITGKIPGAPDYLFISADHAFFIEMKAGKNKQSKSQKMFEKWCVYAGVEYYLCYGSEEAIEVLKRNKILLLK